MKGFNTSKGYGTTGKINHRQALGFSETSRHSYPESFISCTGGILFPSYEHYGLHVESLFQ